MSARLSRRIKELEAELEKAHGRAEAYLSLAEDVAAELDRERTKVAAYERLRGIVRDEVEHAGRGGHQSTIPEAERRVLSRNVARARLARRDLSPAARARCIEQALREGAITEEEAEKYGRDST